ncbi:MAG: hypothetical protein AB7E10_09650 [Burkholderiaceae bacterium]
MTIKILRRLQPTTWLAERLHLSTTTVDANIHCATIRISHE